MLDALRWLPSIRPCAWCVPHPPTHPLPAPAQDDREKAWRIQAVGVAPGSFESRKALPVPWRGLRDEELRCAWEAGQLEGQAADESVLTGSWLRAALAAHSTAFHPAPSKHPSPCRAARPAACRVASLCTQVASSAAAARCRVRWPWRPRRWSWSDQGAPGDVSLSIFFLYFSSLPLTPPLCSVHCHTSLPQRTAAAEC